MMFGVRVLVCAVALLPMKATPAAAQDPEIESAADEGAGDLGRTLDVQTWAGFGGDDAGETTRAQGLAGLNAMFTRTRQRLVFSAGLVGRARVNTGTQRWTAEEEATATVSFGLTRRTWLKLAQLARHGPLDPFSTARGIGLVGLGESATAALDTGLMTRPVLTSDGSTELSHVLSRRSSIALTHRLTFTGGERASRAHLGGARFEYRMGPRAVLRLGYRFGEVRFDSSGERTLQTHDVDLGVDYTRSLFSPQTTVSVATGSSVIGEGTRRTLRVLATATLAHSLNRRWRASLAYGRPLQYLEGVGTPIVSDRVDLALHGEVGRRSRVDLVGGYSVGALAMSADQGVTSYVVSVRWHARVNRRAGVQAESFYGRSQFDDRVRLPPDIQRRVSHLGVRAFVTYALTTRRGPGR